MDTDKSLANIDDSDKGIEAAELRGLRPRSGGESPWTKIEAKLPGVKTAMTAARAEFDAGRGNILDGDRLIPVEEFRAQDAPQATNRSSS